MMEGNRDEAEKCIELATTYLQEGNYEKAEKLLLKSERLYPTSKARDLIEKVRAASNGDEGIRRRKFSVPKKDDQPFKTSENKENFEANKEHMDAVRRIKKCKDYYEMLGVTKESTDSEIKKAYKKLALQLHPDKNKSPGAAEAFKALGNAAGVLTDPEKRKQYDLYGTDEERLQHMNSRGDTTTHYSRGFEADVTPEELFNMFFGAGFPTNANIHTRRSGGRVYRTQDPNYSARNNQHSSGVVVQLLSIAVLIILSMMSSFFVSDPIYSLHHSSKFPVERKTLNLKVPYFVKENFHNEYQGSLRRLEMTIEEEYITNLRHACYKEKTYRDSLIYKAKSFGNRDLYIKAQNQDLPSCNLLGEIHQRHGD